MSSKPLILVAFLVFILGLFHTTDACTCIRRDALPRNVGCKDEFMAILNVTGVEHNGHENGYRFKVIEDYSSSLATPISLNKFSQIQSTSNVGACGLLLQVNATYLIRGHVYEGQLHINMCTTYAKVLHEVPAVAEAKAMLANLYNELC